MKAITSKVFLAISTVGIGEAIYHASLEGAFTTNIFAFRYSQFASFFGVPYWIFGVVWFPLILLVGLWATKIGRVPLGERMLVLLTIGNFFTGYMWYLDIEVVKAYHPLYIALYATNYALTGLVVVQNKSSDIMQGYVYGTVTGAVIGLLFGPYGVAACGIVGGLFGGLRNFVSPKNHLMPASQESKRKYLEDKKAELEKRLKEIELELRQAQ